MRAKEIFFDFLETVFLIICILFFFFYIFIGGHYDIAKKIFQTAGILSIFGIFFVIRWKLMKEQIRKKEKEYYSNDIVAYLGHKEIVRDRIVIFLISFFVLMLAFFIKPINSLDFIQSLTVFCYMNVAHLIIFSKKNNMSNIITLNEIDEIKERILIFLLALIILSETLFFGGANFIDFFQIAFIYGAFYLWHKYIFKI